MRLVSRWFRRRPATVSAPPSRPTIFIAERFVARRNPLQLLDLPDDVRGVAPGQPLDAVVLDEFAADSRRVRLTEPPPGMAGNRLRFAPMPINPEARLWLFVINGDYAGGATDAALPAILLGHARSIGGRAPINLIWIDPSEDIDLDRSSAQPPVGQQGQAAGGGPAVG